MRNPFLYDGALTNNTSINKLVLNKLPLRGIADDIEGKSAHDIFSTRLIIERIKNYAAELNIDLLQVEENLLPICLNRCLENSDPVVKSTAEDIVQLFGKRLGLILLTLRKGEPENRLLRNDWEAAHWDYWNKIQTVILVGGLASGNLGKGIKFWIEEIFRLSGEKQYNIVLSQNSAFAATSGCSSYIRSSNSTNMILDLGQSFIKRSIVSKVDGRLEKVQYLSKLPSLYTDWVYDDCSLVREDARLLNEYLVKVILDTFREAAVLSLGTEIVISIANYVNNGVLTKGRGGYAKLSFLAENYGQYLSNRLSSELNKEIEVLLIHDGTAMAASFRQYNNSVCISLGTAFGIGFP